MLIPLGTQPPFAPDDRIRMMWVVDHIKECEGFEFFLVLTDPTEPQNRDSSLERRRRAGLARVDAKVKLDTVATTHGTGEATHPQPVVDEAVDKVDG